VAAFDQMLQVMGSLALLLFLTPGAFRRWLSDRSARRLQRGGMVLLAGALAIAIGATIRWSVQR
jgi:hypothetical protein